MGQEHPNSITQHIWGKGIVTLMAVSERELKDTVIIDVHLIFKCCLQVCLALTDKSIDNIIELFTQK